MSRFTGLLPVDSIPVRERGEDVTVVGLWALKSFPKMLHEHGLPKERLKQEAAPTSAAAASHRTAAPASLAPPALRSVTKKCPPGFTLTRFPQEIPPGVS